MKTKQNRSYKKIFIINKERKKLISIVNKIASIQNVERVFTNSSPFNAKLCLRLILNP